jgi:hypothetical protein
LRRWIQLSTLRFSITFLTAEQKTVGGIEVLGLSSKNLNNIRFSRLLFLFKLEQFTFVVPLQL